MNEIQKTRYERNRLTIKICLDVALNKIDRKEDPVLIEKVIKGIDMLLLECYNLNPGEYQKGELIKMHEQNVLVLGLLNLAKTHGWEMIEFE